MNVNS